MGNANLDNYGEDDTSTSSFFGIATRGFVESKPMVGGLNIVGSEPKKVMIRVKGPSMNFAGTLLPNPMIIISKYKFETSAYDRDQGTL